MSEIKQQTKPSTFLHLRQLRELAILHQFLEVSGSQMYFVWFSDINAAAAASVT